MRRIRFILMDLVNTILNYEEYVRRSWPLELQVLRRYRRGISKKEYLQARSQALLTRGLCWRTRDYWSSLAAKLNIREAPEALLELFDSLSRRLILRAVRPYHDSHFVLRELKLRGHRLALVTNLTPWEAKLIDNFGLTPYFDSIIVSSLRGVRKPDARAFLSALEDLHGSPSEAAMIGDRYDSDIAPAKKLGMLAIRIRRGWFSNQLPLSDAASMPDYELKSLAAVLEVPELATATS